MAAALCGLALLGGPTPLSSAPADVQRQVDALFTPEPSTERLLDLAFGGKADELSAAVRYRAQWLLLARAHQGRDLDVLRRDKARLIKEWRTPAFPGNKFTLDDLLVLLGPPPESAADMILDYLEHAELDFSSERRWKYSEWGVLWMLDQLEGRDGDKKRVASRLLALIDGKFRYSAKAVDHALTQLAERMPGLPPAFADAVAECRFKFLDDMERQRRTVGEITIFNHASEAEVWALRPRFDRLACMKPYAPGLRKWTYHYVWQREAKTATLACGGS